MTIRIMGALLVIAALLAGTVPLDGHHSLASQFDEAKPLTLQGVITKVDWINPHVYLHLEVKGKDDAVEQWSLETLPPGMLRRGGLRSDMLGRGQTVTILGYHARNGSNLAFLRKITFADGKEVVVWIGDIKQAR